MLNWRSGLRGMNLNTSVRANLGAAKSAYNEVKPSFLARPGRAGDKSHRILQ